MSDCLCLCIWFIVFYIMKYLRFGLVSVLVGCCGNAHAFIDGVRIGAGASVLGGLNVIAGYGPRETDGLFGKLGVRLDFSSTAPIKSALDSMIDHLMRDGVSVGDGVRIDEGKLDSTHYAALVDFYPFSGMWRLTAGYMFSDVHMDAAIKGEIENIPSQRFYFYINGDHYYYNGNVFRGGTTIDWDFNGPYFGTGADIRLGCGFYLYLDAGVVYTNRPSRLVMHIPHEQLYTYDVLSATWSPVTIPKLDSDVADATEKANRKLGHLRLFPVIKVGFLYRF